MASGTGNLPNQNMDFTPFDILTAEEMDDLVENIESLADGTGIGDGAIGTSALAQSVWTAIGDYSTSEVATPFKWVDGKTIYRKTINFGALPNATTKNVAHGVTGLDNIIGMSMWATDGTNHIFPNHAAGGTGDITLFRNGSNITVNTQGTNRSAYTVSYVTLWYTKT